MQTSGSDTAQVRLMGREGLRQAGISRKLAWELLLGANTARIPREREGEGARTAAKRTKNRP